MFKLIRLKDDVLAVINTTKKVYWYGNNINTLINVMNRLGVNSAEVTTAIEDMRINDTNCADFGEIHGTFLYSERKTMQEIDELIPNQKERPAC